MIRPHEDTGLVQGGIISRIKRRQLLRIGFLTATLLATAPPGHKHTLHPPKWLGWSLVSIGSVLVLYSLALKRPGG